jgi:hypothetical protein
MSLQLFLDGNTWKGGEFPEEPNEKTYSGDQWKEHQAKIEYGAAVEKGKTEALEVVNPEMLSPKIFKFSGGYAIQNGILESTKVVYGVLYHWDGGWEIENICSKGSCATSNSCYAEGLSFEKCAARKVLRLIPKAPVSEPDPSQTVENFHKCIVATGIPEPLIPGANWINPHTEFGAGEHGEMLPTNKKIGIMKCAEWLSFCLSIGWGKDQLDGLEKIWHQHHDEAGNLVKPALVNDAGGGREWISVKDRIPDNYNLVLICMTSGAITVGRRLRTNKWGIFTSSGLDIESQSNHVDYWQLLPTKP